MNDSDGMNNLDWAMAELGKAIGELLSRELKEKDKRIADLETELASYKRLNEELLRDFNTVVKSKDEAQKLWEAEAKQRDQLDKALRQIQMKVREALGE